MTDLEIDELLEKNPAVKEVFERNEAKVAEFKLRKKSEYRLGLPYGRRQLTSGSQERFPPASHVKKSKVIFVLCTSNSK